MNTETGVTVDSQPTNELTTGAESSPANYSQEALNSLTPEQRTEWKSSGKLPGEQKTEKSSESSPADKSGSASASEAEKKKQEPSPGQKQPTPAELRIRELHSKATQETERANRLQQELDALRKPKEAARVEPAKAADDPEPTTQDLKPDGSPRFTDWAEFNKASIAWQVKQALKAVDVDKTVDTKLTERQQADARAKNMEQWSQGWDSQVVSSKEKHGDFQDVVRPVLEQKVIPLDGVIDAYLARTPHGSELLYHLASNQAEIQRISAIADPYSAWREMAMLELKMFGETPVVPGEKKVPPAPKITKATDPIKTVSGTNAEPEDPIQAALSAGNMREYKRLCNARDAKAAQGG